MRTFSISMVAVAALLLAACGGDDEGGGASLPGRGTASIVGTWAPDVTAIRPEIEKMTLESMEGMREGLPADQFEQMKKQMLDGMRERFKGAEEARLVISGDGTFAIFEKAGGPERGKGTWSLEGTTITVTQTEDKGETLDDPQILTARLEDGRIRMKPDPQMPFDLVFRRTGPE